jgi:hypothetical protein
MSPDAFTKLALGGKLKAASAVLSRNFGAEVGIVSFLPFDPDRPLSVGSLIGLPPAGACQVMHLNSDPFGNTSPSSRTVPQISPVVIPFVQPDSQYFDAGPSLSLSGPAGFRQLLPLGISPYTGLLNTPTSVFLAGGSYAIDSVSEGRDIGGFHATIGLNPTLTWTNRPSGFAQFSRRSPISITWNGGDPQHEFVMISATLSA